MNQLCRIVLTHCREANCRASMYLLALSRARLHVALSKINACAAIHTCMCNSYVLLHGTDVFVISNSLWQCGRGPGRCRKRPKCGGWWCPIRCSKKAEDCKIGRMAIGPPCLWLILYAFTRLAAAQRRPKGPAGWVVKHNLAEKRAVFGSRDVSISRNPETSTIRKTQLRCRTEGLRRWNRPKYPAYAPPKRLKTVYFGSSSVRPVCTAKFHETNTNQTDFQKNYRGRKTTTQEL